MHLRLSYVYNAFLYIKVPTYYNFQNKIIWYVGKINNVVSFLVKYKNNFPRKYLQFYEFTEQICLNIRNVRIPTTYLYSNT